jgi:hypothetical protein
LELEEVADAVLRLATDESLYGRVLVRWSEFYSCEVARENSVGADILRPIHAILRKEPCPFRRVLISLVRQTVSLRRKLDSLRYGN